MSGLLIVLLIGVAWLVAALLFGLVFGQVAKANNRRI